LVSISVGEGELVSCILPAGFVLLEEDIQLEAEDVLALIPPRAHVPQQLSVAACFEERLMFLGLWAGGLELCEVLCCSPLLDGAK